MANKTTYEIIAKTKGFKESGSQVKSLTGSLGGLTTKLVGVAGAYFGSRALLDGINASIDAFKQQELAEKQLEQALGRTSNALLQQASEMQNLTGIGDEAIIAQQAFLGSIGMTEDQIKDILPVAADLAAATGLTLESAVRNTAKTFSGLAGELGELVPQVRDLTSEQMKAGEAVKVMADLFRGQAVVQAKSLSGMTNRVTLAMGDMAEEVGGFLEPAIRSLAETFLLLTGNATEEEEVLIRLTQVTKDLEQAEKLGLQPFIERLSLKKEELELQARALGLRGEEIDGFADVRDQQQIDIHLMQSKNQFLSDENDIKEVSTELTALRNEELFKEVEASSQILELTEKELRAYKLLVSAKKVGANIESAANSKIAGSFAQLNEAMGYSAQLTKTLTIGQAYADAYAGAARAFREHTFPKNVAVAAVSLAQGISAADKAKASYSQGLDMYEEGGLIGGNRHSQGGTIIEAEQGEYIMSRNAVENIGVDTLETMNAGGGSVVVNVTGNVMSEDFVENELADKISIAVKRGVDFGIV